VAAGWQRRSQCLRLRETQQQQETQQQGMQLQENKLQESQQQTVPCNSGL
jgi:hypothetical protein